MNEISEFAQQNGMDTSPWRFWSNEQMISISQIGSHAEAAAVQQYILSKMGFAAELNEPLEPGGPWGVVAILTPGSADTVLRSG